MSSKPRCARNASVRGATTPAEPVAQKIAVLAPQTNHRGDSRKSAVSLAIVCSRAQAGIEAPLVTVEVHLSAGLPALAIVGLIVGVAIVNVDKIFGGAQVKTAKLFIDNIKIPLATYRMEKGTYPSTAEGLQILLQSPNPGTPPYIDDPAKLKDPWGQPYQYRFPGTKNKFGYDVWSKGPDGQDGTADDVGNWPEELNTTGGIPGMPGQ
jgi:general secretion pathway protein G